MNSILADNALIGNQTEGRASASPLVDLMITLLSMGVNGYNQLLEQRKVGACRTSFSLLSCILTAVPSCVRKSLII